MIYNLAQLLRTQFPTETVYVNGRVKLAGQQHVPARNVLLIDNGGTEKPWVKYQTCTVQVVARDVDAPKAKVLADALFVYVTSRFGLILPAITVDGVVHAQVSTAQISALQVPYYLGPDEDGRHEYVFNITIIKER